MEPGDLTTEEATLVRAIAALEAEGRPTYLEAVAERAGMPAGQARVVLSRLLGELGLVQEVDEGAAGPFYVLSGRAGADQEERPQPGGEGDLLRSLEQSLAGRPFPATTEDVVAAAAEGGAPQTVVQALRRLQPDRTYMTLQELVEAVRAQL